MIDNAFINREALELIKGKTLGRGMTRTVYSYALDPTLVIKIEEKAQSFQNIREWEYWNENKDFKPIAEWLAPCIAISPCGSILIQKKTTPQDPKKYPKIIPHFLTDLKYQNFGLLDGKLVCHDYGSIPLSVGVILVKGKTKTKKADWWGDKDID